MRQHLFTDDGVLWHDQLNNPVKKEAGGEIQTYASEILLFCCMSAPRRPFRLSAFPPFRPSQFEPFLAKADSI